jgi:hypothetical protein
MCVIYYAKDKSTLLANADLKLASAENDDGVGIMFPIEGKIVTLKSKASWKYERLLAQVPEGTSLGLHFRYATAGKRNHANAHPFEIAGGKAALMHNGVVQGRGDSQRSDTREVCEVELANGSMADDGFRAKIGTLFNGSRVLTFDLETRHWRAWGSWAKGSITGDFAQSSHVEDTSLSLMFARYPEKTPRMIRGTPSTLGSWQDYMAAPPWEEAGYLCIRDWMQAEPEQAARYIETAWEQEFTELDD